jgi:hypothetical protein
MPERMVQIIQAMIRILSIAPLFVCVPAVEHPVFITILITNTYLIHPFSPILLPFTKLHLSLKFIWLSGSLQKSVNTYF